MLVPFRFRTLELEFAEETYVELTKTEIETEDPATFDPSTTTTRNMLIHDAIFSSLYRHGF